MEKNSKQSIRFSPGEDQQNRVTAGGIKPHTATRGFRRHPGIKGIVQAAMLCLLVGAGCDDLIAVLGEERTVTLRLRGTVTAATDGSAFDGATVALGVLLHAGIDAYETLASAETASGGKFAISHTTRCSSFTPLQLRVGAPSDWRASRSVRCTDAEQIINVALQPSPSGS